MTGEQIQAFTFLRSLAEQGHYRVIPDGEGFPILPGRLGSVEWFTSTGLAVYSPRPRAFARLEAVPGVTRWQIGSTEARYLAPIEALPTLAGVLGLRRRRSPTAGSWRPAGSGGLPAPRTHRGRASDSDTPAAPGTAL